MSAILFAARRHSNVQQIPAGGGGGTITDNYIMFREDGGSGSTHVMWPIILPANTVFSAGDLANIRLTVAGSEPASGVKIALLDGQRSTDGSYISAIGEFVYNIPNASSIDVLVDYGVSRSVPDLSAFTLPGEYVNVAWMQNPIACILNDPAKACDREVFPLPILPDTSLNAACLGVLTALRAQDSVEAGGTAEYDMHSARWAWWGGTASRSWYTRACRSFVSNGGQHGSGGEPPSQYNFSERTAPSGSTPYDFNPAGYTGTFSGQNETVDDSLSNLLAYRLCGWSYGKHNVAYTLPLNFFDGCTNPLGLVVNVGDDQNLRPAWRRAIQNGVVGVLLGLSQKITFSGFTFGDPLSSDTRTLMQRIIDRLKMMRDYAEDGARVRPSWMSVIPWGTGQNALTGAINTYQGKIVSAADTSHAILDTKTTQRQVDNYYSDFTMYVIGGTNAGLHRTTNHYNNSTGEVTFSTPWPTPLDNTSVYWILDNFRNSYTGAVGTGTFSSLSCTVDADAGIYRITFTSSTAFTVTHPFGVSMPTGTVGVAYSSHGISFTLNAGGTAFVTGDVVMLDLAGSTRQPVFQMEINSPVMVMMLHNGLLDSDATFKTAVKAHLHAMNLLAKSQVVPNTTTNSHGDTVRGTQYSLTNPAVLNTSAAALPAAEIAFHSAVLWSAEGDTAARDVFDATFIAGSLSDESFTIKTVGQVGFMASHSAALRCGATLRGVT